MEYIIKVSELYQKAKEMLNDGMDYVEISLCEPDTTDPDDPLPASVHFEAFKKTSSFEGVDYEDIEVADEDFT